MDTLNPLVAATVTSLLISTIVLFGIIGGLSVVGLKVANAKAH